MKILEKIKPIQIDERGSISQLLKGKVIKLD